MYLECKKCIATPFCKRYTGETPKPEGKWCSSNHRLYCALELSNIPVRYYHANIYNYKEDKDNQVAFSKIVPTIGRIIEEVASGVNFLFEGKFGVGKTHHGAMLLNHFIYKACLTSQFDFENPLSLFVVYSDLIDRLRYYRDEVDTFNTLQIIKSVPLLLLDDIGSGTNSDYTKEQTYLIVNHRYNKSLSTIVTSNLGLREMVGILGERTVSRLTANLKAVTIGGGDRRRDL